MTQIQKYVTEVYFYRSIEERTTHCEIMKNNGYEADDRIKYDTNHSLSKTNSVLYGLYRKSLIQR